MLSGPMVSRWQGAVDWPKVAQAGYTYSDAQVGRDCTLDPYFARNRDGVRAAGLKLGMYYFLSTRQSAAEQVDWALAQMGDALKGSFFYVDFETLHLADGSVLYPTYQQLVEFRDAWYAKTNHPLGVYTGKWYWDRFPGATAPKDTYLFHSRYLADAGASYGGWIGPGDGWWTFWQYTSVGAVPGINGNVCLSRFPGSMSTLELLGGEMQFIQARWYATGRTKPVRLVVIHDMEEPETYTMAEAVANYFHTTDAPSHPSAHYTADADSTVQCVRESDTAWHAPGVNPESIGIEMTGVAAQTTAQWNDAYSSKMLREQVAPLVRGICERWNLPKQFVNAAGLLAGKRGITTHAEVTKAYGQSTHTDPGPNFPMADFISLVNNTPTGDEFDMATISDLRAAVQAELNEFAGTRFDDGAFTLTEALGKYNTGLVKVLAILRELDAADVPAKLAALKAELDEAKATLDAVNLALAGVAAGQVDEPALAAALAPIVGVAVAGELAKRLAA